MGDHGGVVGGFRVLVVAATAAVVTTGAAVTTAGCSVATLAGTPAPTSPAGTTSTTGPPVATTLPPGVPTGIGPWRLAGRTEVLGAFSDQGLATVARPGRAATVAYRGTLTVTGSLERQGWDHVGDPDSWQGWLVEPFQGGPGATAKMFRVTSPDGSVTEAVHPLVAGEAANNSFAAVSPDGRWTVSAEWGTESRLLVYPTPVVNPGAPPGRPLPLAGTISLDRAVRDLQGCAFASSTRLVCADSDPSSDLWPEPDQVLQVDLAGPLSGSSTSARVTMLGQVPMTSGCTGPYEPEGVDIDRPDGLLRLTVAPPGICNLYTQVYEYRLAP